MKSRLEKCRAYFFSFFFKVHLVLFESSISRGKLLALLTVHSTGIKSTDATTMYTRHMQSIFDR